MPSDETRRLLKNLGVAVTRYEDAVLNNASAEEIAKCESEALVRFDEVKALFERLRSGERARSR